MSEFINFKSKIVEQKAKARLKKSGLLRRVGNRDYVGEEAALGVTKMQFCSDKFTDGDLADLGYFANLKLSAKIYTKRPYKLRSRICCER